MPKVYNPDTQEVRNVAGKDVKNLKKEGFLVVGSRPQSEFLGKTREELQDDDEELEEGAVEQEIGEQPQGAE